MRRFKEETESDDVDNESEKCQGVLLPGRLVSFVGSGYEVVGGDGELHNINNKKCELE